MKVSLFVKRSSDQPVETVVCAFCGSEGSFLKFAKNNPDDLVGIISDWPSDCVTQSLCYEFGVQGLKDVTGREGLLKNFWSYIHITY